MTAVAILKEVARAHRMSVKQMRSRSRTRAHFRARLDAAKRLHTERNLGAGTIARLLGRTYWQALYYINSDFRKRHRAKSRAVMARRKAAA